MSENNQRDLVLAPNEYSYVLDQTKGNVACWVGPSKTSLSQSDCLVKFNSTTKRFQGCSYQDAINLFVSVPEGWYIALKNPAPNNKHPQPGGSSSIPENMEIGRKINIPGPANFALYPGQMARTIEGHSLRSNQYLVARVYDADSVNATEGTEYVNGQNLIIKGTEVSFYIPPTGIEVRPIGDNPNKGYVRDAITLERLEYCILKDENGNKRYVYGPEVVFPNPTESFIVDSLSDSVQRRAIELSELCGVYIKVIADYTDDEGTPHYTGEELFITGKEQKIYYPRPEHTFITYEGRRVHHAIAIPKGQGKYIMNRLTGEIKIIIGPTMYLPDPRYEVVVTRTLTKRQCELWYPGNKEVLKANGHYTPTSKSLSYEDCGTAITANSITMSMTTPTCTENVTGIDRHNTYTPPRSINLDSSKYDGAVSIDIWSNYAVNVVSKDGDCKVIVGPKTILLNYDETLDILFPNGSSIVYLPYKNRTYLDTITVETSDHITAQVNVSYQFSFDENNKDKWFAVNDYLELLCSTCALLIRDAANHYSLIDFYNNYNSIIDKAIIGDDDCYYFEENGMMITSVEVNDFGVSDDASKMIIDAQQKVVSKSLELSTTQKIYEIENQITDLTLKKLEMQQVLAEEEDRINYAISTNARKLRFAENAQKDEEEMRRLAALQQQAELQATMQRNNIELEQEAEKLKISNKQAYYDVDAQREAKSAEALAKVLTSLGPDLCAALNSASNQEVLTAIAGAISPYAIAKDNDIAEAVSKIVRGTTLESTVDAFIAKT